MTIRAVRWWIAVLAVATPAAVAAPASGAVKRGSFAGTTAEGDKIGFRVDGRARVYGFNFAAVTLRCSDGESVDVPLTRVPDGQRFRLRKRRFGIEARNATTGFGWNARGTVARNGRRATGTLRVFARFNDRNKQDADGAISCESARLRWTARRG